MTLIGHVNVSSEGTQLTDAVELAKADAEVDEAAAEQTMKEYEAASK